VTEDGPPAVLAGSVDLLDILAVDLEATAGRWMMKKRDADAA
jgi:hypothetical protein